MKVKFITEKEMKIKEDKNFRNEFISALTELFAETIPVNVPGPEAYEYDKDDDEFDEELCEECKAQNFAYFEAVIKNIELVSNAINTVIENYIVLPAIPDTMDDKIAFMTDLEEKLYFFNLAGVIGSSPTTILKRQYL
jgi:hypothetical protein